MNRGVSFVIPFFNAEKTIERTLNSISKLEIENYEVVCINDGSTDNSKSIISRTPRKNIKVIDLEKNMGVSHARNVGIREATFDKIAFIDADDEITRDIEKAISFDEDITVCRHIINNNSTTSTAFSFGYNDDLTLNRSAIIDLTRKYLKNPVGNSIITHCWGKIYSRKLISNNQIKFDTSLSTYEDLLFVSQCFSSASSIHIFPEIIYEKHVDKDGLGKNFIKHLFAYQAALKEFTKSAFEMDEEGQEAYEKANHYFIAKSLFLSTQNSISTTRKILKSLKNRYSRETLLNCVSNKAIKFFIQSGLINSPLLGATYLRAYGIARK